MVEIEIGIMVRQCLSRRIADKAIVAPLLPYIPIVDDRAGIASARSSA
jgi:hypothetical protein